jgi:hypothetical protein
MLLYALGHLFCLVLGHRWQDVREREAWRSPTALLQNAAPARAIDRFCRRCGGHAVEVISA